ncbi:hypothetical protein AVEN_199356-1 [Araneus ventricosus]|uniref:Uncharacterized protein n=1 Tax=Araneus ventricosus TaxID=182803 RepID=A0A4Y2M1X5_ARAVE|nr:hypothetical protein AVEN_199356-1 [Araneus ventricosus]
MNQGILYRYSPEVETEEAQLVVPFQERERECYNSIMMFQPLDTMELKGLTTKLPLDTIFQVCENTLLNILKTAPTVIVTNRVIRSQPVFLELQFMPKGLKPLLLICLDLFQRPRLVRSGFFS